MSNKECTNEDLERRINKLEIESGSFDVSLKKDIAALEKQMNLQFISSMIAVDAALAAQKELVQTSFTASEQAIAKAEKAQTEYNIRSNEFRGQLDDQAKTLMPRAESFSMFKSFEDKMYIQNSSTEKSLDSLRLDIKSLRESRSELGGRGAGLQAGWGMLLAAVGLIATIVALLSRLR
jgi:hypothetical protein